MTRDDLADAGEHPALDPMPAPANTVTLRREVVSLDHLRRPHDHLAMHSMPGQVLLTTTLPLPELAETLRALADVMEARE